MPRIGFGTAALGEGKLNLIKAAINAGYRLFDSASDTGPWYHSEAAIGTAFREAMMNEPDPELRKKLREELMVTSKLHPQDFSLTRADESFRRTLDNIQEKFVDIYLLHYPSCGPKGYEALCPARDGSEGDWSTIWKPLEMRMVKGEIGLLGVANFNLAELQSLVSKARVKPHLVQSWFDPYHQDWELVNFCREHGIVFQAYSSLGTQWAHRAETDHKNPILTDDVLMSIAAKHGKSVPQIIIRWLLQEDMLVIPRSASVKHITENIEVFDFELSEDELKQIRSLNGKR